MSRAGLIGVVALLGCMALHPRVEGRAMDTFGFGARGMAMANAQTAVFGDAACNYYNPAGLAFAPGFAADIGYLATVPNLRLNGANLGVDDNNGTTLALAIPGQIGPVGLALGFAFYLPDAYLTRVRALPQDQPRFALLDNRTQRLLIGANIAIRPIEQLSIGFGLTFLAKTEGGVALDGTFLPDPADSALNASVDVDFATVRIPQASLAWRAMDGLQFGLIWRGEASAVLDLDAVVDGFIDELLGPEPIAGNLRVGSFNTNFFTPHQVILGVAVEPTPEWLLTLDVGWMHWSAYPPPTANVDIDFTLEGFDTEGLLPEATTVIAPKFRDTAVLRLGSEYRWSPRAWFTLAARAGYAYEPSPAPSQTGETNYIDTDKHLVSLGAGMGFLEPPRPGPHPIELDVGAQYWHWARREMRKRSPADPTGDIVAEGEVWAIAATLRFSLLWD